jgi:transmembrane sensor
MEQYRQGGRALTEQQLALFIRARQGALNAADQQQLNIWQQQPGFTNGWVEMTDLWDEIGFLEAPDLQPLIKRRLSFQWVAGMASAAVLLLIVVAGQFWPVSQQGHSYTTGRGERLLVNLSDGSKAYLGPVSELTVNYSGSERAFQLHRGEAFFDVMSDPNRPFIVHTPYGDFVAVGTRFNVQLKTNSAELAVLEGKVKVLGRTSQNAVQAKTELAQVGDEVSLGKDGEMAVSYDVDVASITAWTTGQLAFNGESLQEAIARINRHSRHEIILRDENLASQPLYGVFNVGDSKSFVGVLRQAFKVRVIEAVDSTLVLPAEDSALSKE